MQDKRFGLLGVMAREGVLIQQRGVDKSLPRDPFVLGQFNN